MNATTSKPANGVQRHAGGVPLRTAAELAVVVGRKRASRNVEANWYDASRWSPSRAWIWQPPQTAKRDLDRYTRYELNKRAEYLSKNSDFIRGLLERLTTLTIGSGIHPSPKSSSKEWNAAVNEFWKEKCKRPCVDSKMTMSQYQRIKARARFTHGESFTILTWSDRFNTSAIQGLEWHRITGSNRNAPGVDNYTGVQGNDSIGGDGIDYDAQGFPLRYHVDGLDAGGRALPPIDEQFMVHHFTPRRDEQTRGETILASAINSAQDVKEILEFEKQAVKDASSKLDIIQTQTGDLDPEMMRKVTYGQGYPTTQQLPDDHTNKTHFYKVQFGNSPVVLKTGDKYTPYVPNRPGNAWEGFMAFLANTIVLGTGGLPPSLVLPIDIGGTDIRRDLKIGQKVIGAWQEDIAAEFTAIREYFILGGVEDRELPKPPKDWRAVEWHFTEALTVDRQQAAMDRDDVQSGLMSWDIYHGRSGRDGDEQEAKIIAEAKRRRFRITGIAESEPFADAAEFTQFLSINFKFSETFRIQDDDGGDSSIGGTPVPGKQAKPAPAAPKPQPQPTK